MLPASSYTPQATFALSGKTKQVLFNVLDSGAVGNAKQVTDGSMSSVSSPTTLTSASANFTAADVGKSIGVQGAAAAGADLLTTIAAFISSTQVTLTVGASTTVSGAKTLYGTDDTTAINAALTAANAVGGGWVYLPDGYNFLISSQLIIYSNTKFQLGTNTSLYLQFNSNSNMLIDSAHNAGTLTVPSPISNIEVCGGYWHRGRNGGTNNAQHSIILGGSNVHVHDINLDAFLGKYAILIQNCRDFCVERIYLPNQYSDGVHIQGPSSNGTVRDIKGVTHDDFVAITPNDYTSFVWGNEGDVTDIVIENLECQTAYTTACKILSGSTGGGSTALNTKRITVRNITGVMANGNASTCVYIGDDGSVSNTGLGHIDDILIDGVNVDFGSAAISNSLVKIIGLSGGTSKNIPKITLRNLFLQCDIGAIVDFSHNVTHLIVDGVSGVTNTEAINGFLYVTQNIANVVLSRLLVSNVSLTNAGTQGGSFINGNSENNATLTEILLTNVVFNNFSFLASLNTTTTISLSNVHGVSNGGIFSVGSAGAVTAYQNPTTHFDTISNTLTGTLVYNNSSVTAIISKSSNYTAGANDSTIIASGSGTTITLPTAVGIAGRQYTIKRSDASNAITVATTSSQTIDGNTTVSLSSNNMALTVQSDGANWQVIGQVATSIL